MDQPEMRASDAERRRTGELLARAMSEGRITVAEFEERTDRALAAKTRGELDEVLADIPQATAAPTTPETDEVAELDAGTFGDLQRTGHWVVPPNLRVAGSFGDVLLDFTQAELSSRLITVDLALGTGSATLVVPPGSDVDVGSVRTGVGELRDRTVRPGQPAEYRFVLRGSTGAGDVRVVHPTTYRIGRLAIHRYPFRIRWSE